MKLDLLLPKKAKNKWLENFYKIPVIVNMYEI
jgi:hypothetical protein